MANKLVVLSFDALQTNDLEQLSRLPYFSQILKKASVVNHIREIYPTLTYPIHTTIITGVHPDKHGISHNQKASIDPKDPDWSIMGSDWYWEKENIKVKTLVDTVWEQGGNVATVLWPVTAGDNRGYNIPEIWPVRGSEQKAKEVYAKASSPLAMRDYYDRYIAHYDWSNNEDMVYYGVEIALDILKKQKPNLLLCHLVHLDHIRHLYGDQGREVNNCLKQLDIIAERFIQATREAGTFEETNFIILGDHGQIDIDTVFNLNVLLKDMGFIRIDACGKAESFDAYSFSAGFSTQIMLANSDDQQLEQKVYAALLDIQMRYPQYIERVYKADEVEREEHLKGDFSFVLEGTLGTLFQNSLTDSLIIPFGSSEYKFYRAMHGHHPAKGNKPPLIAFGPDILPSERLISGDMMSIYPTLALLLGVSIPEVVDGKPFPILKT
ncbi:alkaline phosphatase family protein [Oscillospiraceae bacterium LTW-04]|nr:alkaline phosphatase family protein [Oscillospiraceae bacterium MB24-C1]